MKRLIKQIKPFSLILLATLALTACEKEAEEKQPAVTAEKITAQQEHPTEPDAAKNDTESGHHGHDHSQSTPLAEGASVMGTLGSNYEVVEPQATCEKPVVIEFYAYHCPHCNNLEPAAEAWRKKVEGKVEFVSVPTDLGNKQMLSMVLVHHAAKKLGVLEKTKKAIFNRFHVEKKLFSSEDEAAQFLAEQGADLAEAKKALLDQEAFFASYNKDLALLNGYKITSVPKILVNHKYMTDITLAGGHKQVFELVDELLVLENSCQTN